LGIAELDILADENRLLAERLAGSGVSVRTEVWPGTTHGFLQMTRDVAVARSAVRTIANVSAEFAKA
jgi:acetyl esterase/lipase